MLKNHKIYISILERDFVQELNFSRWKRNIFIDIARVVEINKTKKRKLLVETFFNNFVRVLQLAIVAKLSLVANFFYFWNDKSFILNYCHSRAQIHRIIDHHENNRRDEDDKDNNNEFRFQRIIDWDREDFWFRKNNNDCRYDSRLIMFELLQFFISFCEYLNEFLKNDWLVIISSTSKYDNHLNEVIDVTFHAIN